MVDSPMKEPDPSASWDSITAGLDLNPTAKELTTPAILVRLTRLAAPLSRQSCAAVALGAGASLCAIGLASTSAWLLDRASQHPAVLSLTAVIGAVQLFALGRAGLRYAERLTSHDRAMRVLSKLRVLSFEALEPLSPGALGGARSGDLLARCVADVDILQNFYLRVLEPIAVSTIASVLAIALAWFFVPWAGLILAAGLVSGGLLIPFLASQLGASKAKELAHSSARLVADVVDILQGAFELAAWGRAGELNDHVLHLDAKVASLEKARARRRGLVEALGLAANGGTALGMLAVAIPYVQGAHLPGVDLAILPVLGLAAMDMVSNLPSALLELQRDIQAARRLFELERVPPPVKEPDRQLVIPLGAPDVSLQNAAVRYPSSTRQVLSGIDLELPAGERVAIMGRSGSGKTSLVHLLLRFWPLYGGSAYLSGTAFDDLRGDDIRRLIGALDQRAYLFSASIAENLRVAKPDATDEELTTALSVAQLEQWVGALPAGLATYVGERGAEVSGGERQRLALARILLGGFPVLLLDEPTASLDSATADALIDDLVNATQGKAVLLVTHRRADIREADRLMHLKEGMLYSTERVAQNLPW
ncbi:MAG: thiol reductant ABC exporter subunit CydC [Actinobacteria bacterium]|nr:thiol reductant ABC exporter subunit CydC [Actinomycetota bacterium]